MSDKQSQVVDARDAIASAGDWSSFEPTKLLRLFRTVELLILEADEEIRQLDRRR